MKARRQGDDKEGRRWMATSSEKRKGGRNLRRRSTASEVGLDVKLDVITTAGQLINDTFHSWNARIAVQQQGVHCRALSQEVLSSECDCVTSTLHAVNALRCSPKGRGRYCISEPVTESEHRVRPFITNHKHRASIHNEPSLKY